MPGRRGRRSPTRRPPAPTGSRPPRAAATVESSRVYDDHGRVTSSTDETGTTTTVTYDEAFGLITGVTIVGADGSRSETSHTLSDDRKTIVGATTSYAAPGQPLSARSTTTYAYDTTGQLLQRTMTWAPGAEPRHRRPGHRDHHVRQRGRRRGADPHDHHDHRGGHAGRSRLGHRAGSGHRAAGAQHRPAGAGHHLHLRRTPAARPRGPPPTG